MQENYLAKWLNNELSGKELEDFKKSAEYTSYQKIAEVSKTMEAPEFNIERALTNFKTNNLDKEVKVVQLNPMRKLMRIAAAIAVIAVGSYIYLSSLNESIATQYAENTQVILPDNSEVALNADSKISYNEKKWDEKRSVSLEGEAFFKVAKGERFTVATEDGLVAVLGTQFNVENRKGYFEVSCYEGLVSVTYKGKETKVPAGSSFMAINGKITNTEVQKNAQPSWINKESSFKSTPLHYVLAEFERQHNIRVETRNIDKNKLFTGTFSNTDAKLALESISVPSQIKFKLEGNKVLFYAEDAK
ncbi:ferric-dicitrate binding protein FerR (iron transport regulator) [Saonia flava]|uniref:Ferric-dicitrate binding protein FerR (Iron transport regulator) n=1 Tax=Saonia flava TaxID=523696 RepID=A0A846QWJ1_9FLAO|nr:FecR domain-containing protein [Saonia flava]NJB72711.1 ferric-dicitrate binding protein FerR (iron transport regulator) [Saonia flava]